MFSGIIVLGVIHGIIFLPVLLSYVGPERWGGKVMESNTISPDATVIENYAVAVECPSYQKKQDIEK